MVRSNRRQTVLVGVFLLIVTVYMFTVRRITVRGDSMEPTYQDGQAVLVWQRNRLHNALQRGDVVVVRKDRDTLIKRVAYLPGEEITDSSVLGMTFFNRLADYYEQPGTQRNGRMRLLVPAGYIVVLGDNRRVSYDSRGFGPVPLRDILGVVVAAPPAPPGITP